MTNVEVMLAVGGGMFMTFMILVGLRILQELKQIAQFQIMTERRLSKLEVRVDHLERAN